MPSYVVMFPADNEKEWEAGSDADHQRTYDKDAEFIRRLEERGGSVTGGAELADSASSRSIVRGASTPVVTDGPYAESVEQLSGFYLVRCADLDRLTDAATVLTDAHPVVECRLVVE